METDASSYAKLTSLSPNWPITVRGGAVKSCFRSRALSKLARHNQWEYAVRTLTVEMSSTTSAPSIPDGQEIINRVFIGGLARDTSELELENFFTAYGEVTDVRIVCDRKTGYNKGYGFVTFTTTQARDALLEKGTIDYKGGRKLRLRKAVKKETGGQFFSLNNCSNNMSQNGVIGGQIVLVPVVEPTPAPAPTPATIQPNPVCYIQQPSAVNYHNYMAQQYNWPNCPPGQVYYYYY